MAERLGRPPRSEWRRLCKADQARKDFHAFADLLDGRRPQDADFEEIHPEKERDHRVRSAYLMGAIMAGSFCMVVGALLLF